MQVIVVFNDPNKGRCTKAFINVNEVHYGFDQSYMKRPQMAVEYTNEDGDCSGYNFYIDQILEMVITKEV